MITRSLTRIAIAGALVAACGGPQGHKTAAKPRSTPAAPESTAHSPADALLADADVAVASGDLLSARDFAAQALRLDPGNAVARARLVQLGGTPAPVAMKPSGPTTVAVVPAAAPGAAPAVVPGAPSAVPQAAARRRAGPARTAVVAVALRRPAAPQGVAPGEVEGAEADGAASAAGTTSARRASGMGRAKHKRTYPWTRAQRWLVAKGLGGGAGAGVVLGAIVGNVPGALLAGSVTGGAIGFKRATKIGPAAPYPTEHEAAVFEARHGRPADDASAVAAREVATRDAAARVLPPE